LKELPKWSIGYALARAYWSHGYATEAAKAALKYCVNVSGQRRIVAIIDPENHASIRVAEKIGMTFERMIEWDGQPATLYSIRSSL
jgi:[ribosomal protein S5]-alanine N-acetyltransferase